MIRKNVLTFIAIILLMLLFLLSVLAYIGVFSYSSNVRVGMYYYDLRTLDEINASYSYCVENVNALNGSALIECTYNTLRGYSSDWEILELERIGRIDFEPVFNAYYLGPNDEEKVSKEEFKDYFDKLNSTCGCVAEISVDRYGSLKTYTGWLP